MLNEQNQNLVTQIANLYCQDDLCKQSVFMRFSILTDELFDSIISRLSQGRFYYFTNAVPVAFKPGFVDLKFSYNDILTNEAGEGIIKNIPTSERDPIKIFNRANLTFLGRFNEIDVVQNKNIAGYGLALTQTPVNPVGGDEGRYGVAIDPPDYGTNGATVPTVTKALSGFDLNSLLMPALLIGGFFLLKDKF